MKVYNRKQKSYKLYSYEPVRFRLCVLSKILLPFAYDTSVHLASVYFFYFFYAATNLL